MKLRVVIQQVEQAGYGAEVPWYALLERRSGRFCSRFCSP